VPAKTKLKASPDRPTRYPLTLPYMIIARASGNGAKTDIMKLMHRITDDAPKSRSLPIESCGCCMTSVFIPV
jgi:hypothetical protein